MRQRSFVACVPLMVIFAACATDDHAVTWDEVSTTNRATEKGERSRPTPEALARTYHSGVACAADARAMVGAKEEEAWRLMRGCMARPDFVDLLTLTEEPWKARCARDPAALPLLLDLIVRRGADDAVDDLAKVGVMASSPEDIFDATKSGPVSLVVMRGQVRSADGFGIVILDEVSVEQPTSGRGRWVYVHRNVAPVHRKTGRVFRAQAATDADALDVGAEYLVALRPRGVLPSRFDGAESGPARFDVVHAALLVSAP